MMGNRPAWVMSLLVVILSIFAPLAIILIFAEEQSVKNQVSRAEMVSGEIVRRGDQAADQILVSNSAVAEMDSQSPCSDESIQRMRSIVLSSNQIAGVGYIANNRLMCSSIGLHGAGIPVGKPAYLGTNNTAVRTNVELPLSKGKSFLILTDLQTGASSILHSDVAIDVLTNTPEISLGLFSYISKQTIVNRGEFDQTWMERLGENSKVQWEDGKRVIALERSKKFDLVAFTAIPKATFEQERYDMAVKLLPVSVVSSILIAMTLLKVMRRQSSLPALLRNGLRKRELSMVYQPLVDLETGRWIGVEALVRWKREDGTSVPPDVFIPIAEQYGLIGKVTDRVLELVSKDCLSLVRTNAEFHVAINLSAADFASGNIGQRIIAWIKRLNIDTSSVMVEATEHVFMDLENAKRNLVELRDGGVKVAIDDFGTGYSSLSYLTTLQVDFIKIDKAFVDTIGTEAATSHVVNHIIMMAKSLNIRMIAEGVETEQQAAYLREKGVQYAQGWLFSKPLKIEDIEAHLQKATKTRIESEDRELVVYQSLETMAIVE